jgi:hypothetical protein
MYRTVFLQPQFESLRRQHFDPIETLFLNLPIVNPVMKWSENLSLKYNQQEAIENIKKRFKNSYKCIYITVNELKQNKDFKALIYELRNKGFNDWQITLSIMNFMLSYKTRVEIKNHKFETEEQNKKEFNKVFHKLLLTDEKDVYIKFPLSAFQSKEFEFQLNNTLVVILQSFGLENNARFPNFKAVEDFLNIRFNMKNDNSDDDNLLQDI